MIKQDSFLQNFSFMRNCFEENSYILDLENDVCIISDKLAEVFGLTESEFKNATDVLLSFVCDQDKPLFLSTFSLVNKHKRHSIMIEYRVKIQSGHLVQVNNKADLISLNDGKNNYLIGRMSLENNQEHKDILTGLDDFEHCIQDYELLLRRKDRVSGYLLKIGIDNMNAINERMGKNIGDRVLKIVANCAKKACNESTYIYRGTADDFIVMNLSGETGPDACHFYNTLKRYISESEDDIDYKVIFSISAGVVAFLKSDLPFSDYLQRINFALQYVKDHGKNNIKTFDFKEYQKFLDKFALQEELRLSIKNNFEGFKLFYQPVIDATEISLDTNDFSKVPVIGAEALLRWETPKRELLGANKIVPILEEFDLIIPLGRWILLSACKQCKAWNQYLPHFRMSINISYIQIQKSDVVFDVRNALDRSHVNPHNIVLEITESGSLDDKEIINLIRELRELNVGIDIDDFGTGYSNMRYLQEMNADTIKLDYSMIQKAVNPTADPKDKIVVDHIARLAKDLNMKICMEGIETSSDVKKLIGLKPNKFQGFLFGSPMEAGQFTDKQLHLENIKEVTLPPVDANTFIDENLSTQIAKVTQTK